MLLPRRVEGKADHPARPEFRKSRDDRNSRPWPLIRSMGDGRTDRRPSISGSRPGNIAVGGRTDRGKFAGRTARPSRPRSERPFALQFRPCQGEVTESAVDREADGDPEKGVAEPEPGR